MIFNAWYVFAKPRIERRYALLNLIAQGKSSILFGISYDSLYFKFLNGMKKNITDYIELQWVINMHISK